MKSFITLLIGKNEKKKMLLAGSGFYSICIFFVRFLRNSMCKLNIYRMTQKIKI